MKTATRIFATMGIILGGLAILGCINEPTMLDLFYAFVGGCLFLAWGIVDLCLLKQLDKPLTADTFKFEPHVDND